MSSVSFSALSVDWQRLLTQTLCYGVALSTELCVGVPPLDYAEAMHPAPEATAYVSHALRWIINNQSIPEGLAPLVCQTLHDVSDHLEAYASEAEALRVSCITRTADPSHDGYSVPQLIHTVADIISCLSCMD